MVVEKESSGSLSRVACFSNRLGIRFLTCNRGFHSHTPGRSLFSAEESHWTLHGQL